MLSGLDSPTHLLIILAIAIIVLGPKRLPAAGRALGSAIRNFREGLEHPHDDEQPDAPPAPPATPAPPAATPQRRPGP
jgi:sec-independent protein translocase protein TatA